MPTDRDNGDEARVRPRHALIHDGDEVLPSEEAGANHRRLARGAEPVVVDEGSLTAAAAAAEGTPPWHEKASSPAKAGMGASAFWTIIGTFLPGMGLWPTRKRKLGLGILAVCLGTLAGIGVYARLNLGSLAGIAVRPRWLTALSVLAVAFAIFMCILITATHLLTRPKPATASQRAVGGVLVGLLCFLVSAPLGLAANVAGTQADLVNNLFKRGSSTRSQTRPDLNGGNPWASKARLNILLLGGDSSAVRDRIDPGEGIRTDTTMLASIDTATGNTALIQLPRNLSAFPFPTGSPLASAYPNGYWTGIDGDRENPEFELNSVWDNVPRDHPELFTGTDYPHADALKSAVEGITGLKPDYFLLLNIDGIQKLIDAMGGVTMNVNERIPMGQSKEQFEAGLAPSGGWLEKGPDKHLTGYEAMWYARSRSQSMDPARMARQSCVVDAIVSQANPQNLLTHYDSIATASKSAILTDIPQEMAPAMVDLSLRMKDARMKRVLFAYPTTLYADKSSFRPWNPDVVKMQELINAGIVASMTTPATSAPTTSAAANPQPPQATASSEPSTDPVRTSGETPSASPSAAADPNADLKDACAWQG